VIARAPSATTGPSWPRTCTE